MGAAGVEVTAQKRMGSLPLDDLVARARESAARDHGHALALARVSPDRPLQLSGIVLQPAPDDGKIGPAERAIPELRRKGSVAHIIARDDDEP